MTQLFKASFQKMEPRSTLFRSLHSHLENRFER
jgi:hypothetical protein